MKYIQIFVSLIVLWSFTACVDDQVEPQVDPPDLVKIGEGTEDGVKITVYGDRDKFYEGFNVIYVTLEEGSSPILGYWNEVKLSTSMNTPGGLIGSPVVQPEYDQTTGLYVGAVVFTMPANDLDPWKLEVTYEGRTVTINLNVQALPLGTNHTSAYLGTDGKTYQLTLVNPMMPQIGFNDLLIMVHEVVDAQNYLAKDELDIEVGTEMIASGQVSSGHDHPLSTGEGFYVGKVNLSAQGEWRLNFKLMDGENTLLENGFLDIKI
ncbi:MAG TPA: hypothetical protein VFD72_00900 [Sphingobacteriaceae bacterium]|nr:hypothetical protein [Sphingobacteriaceae bacterium]